MSFDINKVICQLICYPSHPPCPPSLPKSWGEKGEEIGKLGVWAGEASPNTQFTDINPAIRAGTSSYYKIRIGIIWGDFVRKIHYARNVY